MIGALLSLTVSPELDLFANRSVGYILTLYYHPF